MPRPYRNSAVGNSLGPGFQAHKEGCHATWYKRDETALGRPAYAAGLGAGRGAELGVQAHRRSQHATSDV